MSEGVVDRGCRDAIDGLHEVMKLLDLAQINLVYKDKRYTIAFAFLTLWIGFAVADFVAAATVVYSIGPVSGINPEHVFLNPEGAIYMNFTWFGLGLVISFVFSLVSLCYCLFCFLSRRAARGKVRDLKEKLKEAKSAIVETCPTELWYSGEA